MWSSWRIGVIILVVVVVVLVVCGIVFAVRVRQKHHDKPTTKKSGKLGKHCGTGPTGTVCKAPEKVTTTQNVIVRAVKVEQEKIVLGAPGQAGCPGQPGQRGHRGPCGAEGPRGVQGERGLRGPPGGPGPRGPTGIQGPIGPVGNVGTSDQDFDTTLIGPYENPVPVQIRLSRVGRVVTATFQTSFFAAANVSVARIQAADVLPAQFIPGGLRTAVVAGVDNGSAITGVALIDSGGRFQFANDVSLASSWSGLSDLGPTGFHAFSIAWVV